MRAPDSNYELQKIWDDPDRLETWTLQQLEALDMEHDWFLDEVDERRDWSLITTSAHTQRAWRLDRAKAAARQGKLNPLRRLYPEIAEFIHAPRRKRGEHRMVVDCGCTHERLQLALDDVKRIRRLWRAHFGRVYRSAAPTALSIAARRHGLTETQLTSFRSNRHRSR